MTLSQIFQYNRNIVINTDIDGFLCGMVLQKYYGCQIVGMSNSKETIWLDANYEGSVLDPIYVDLFVSNPGVYCIEQHIIGLNQEHNRQLASLTTKINPNLLRQDRTFLGDYAHKYPFGTIHFLIALMEKEGVHVDLGTNLDSIMYVNLNTYCGHITPGQILLRADDALHSTMSAYRDNALDWWDYLVDFSGGAESVKKMQKYALSEDRSQDYQIKDNTGKFFTCGLLCDKADGAFDHNITDANGFLEDRLDVFARFIGSIYNMPLTLPARYVAHTGQFLRNKFNDGNIPNLKALLRRSDLFSYAFIYSKYSKYPNFSYTLNLD